MHQTSRHLLIFLAAGFMLMSKPCMAEKVVAEGVGTTCEDALRQAKNLATERVSGSYLNSQRSLYNDSHLEERLNEYTSGVVTSFRILESSGEQPCKVTIDANVDIERSRILSPPIANKSIDLGHIGALVDKRKDGINMISTLINQPDQYSVDVSDISYTPGAGVTQINFEIRNITYSAQWRADIEALLSVQSKPRIYEKPGAGSLVKGLLTLVALPVLIPAAIIAAPFMDSKPKALPQDPNGSICFETDSKFEKLNCYDGTLATELINQLSNMTYSIALKDLSNNLHRIAPERRFSLIKQYWAPVMLHAESSSERRQNFIVVGANDFPRQEQLYMKDFYLKHGMGLSFIVGTPTPNQLVSNY